MTLDMVNYEDRLRQAVRTFWQARRAAQDRNTSGSRADAGTRGSVTADKHMSGFVELVKAVVTANGLDEADVKTRGCTIPGFFRATKDWDILVMHKGVLVAAIELKSQVGSFGNNFNNRTEEVLGSATDLWTAYREGAFHNGKKPGTGEARPFIGWLMVLEDSPKSTAPVKSAPAYFQAFPEFKGASYLRRYELLCEKLISERLYHAAAIVSTPMTAGETGDYAEQGMRLFVAELAGHVAKVAALTE